MECSTHWRDDKFVEVQAKNFKVKGHFGELGLDWRMILKQTLNKTGYE